MSGPAPTARAQLPRAGKFRRGEPGYRRCAIALFCAGIATFATLYTTQPLLPLFVEEMHVSPGASTLTLALTTATLALGLLPAGWISDRIGRVRTMTISLAATALLGLLCALAPSFGVLLVLRALQGLALAGVPAVGMTYLSEEIDRASLGAATGLFVGGNGVGGMAGRLLAGLLAGSGGWRLAVAGVAGISVVCAVAFWRLAPQSRMTHHSPTFRVMLGGIATHLRDPGQRRLELIAALLMGTHVAVYNGLSFRLAAPPYDLGPAAISAVYLTFALGATSSAMAGRLADRFGRRPILPAGVLIALAGVALTLGGALPIVIAGIAVITIGFFAAHSVAAGWVGARAHSAPAQAAALYLFAYYLGSAVGGLLGGLAWSIDGWTTVAMLAAALLLVALVVSSRLRATPPRPVDTLARARSDSGDRLLAHND